ncbi:MAG: phosphatidylserine decarboxylase [Gammaproteobacteria bacterium]|nr:phosphatidylserine decarboxylase [Gammaproteobacteria bacterium]
MQNSSLSWKERLLTGLFIILPHHLISRIIFKLTRIQSPQVTPVIRWFIKKFKVDMSDAVIQDISLFPSFNDFFVRSLKAESRPVTAGEHDLASPVDGTVSQAGNITNDQLFQAKGHSYSVQDLIGGDALLAKLFNGGRFATIYLAPYNYHRIHMPVEGRLKKMIHVPGRLFSVAQWTVRAISRLFARNERVICLFSTPAGPVAMVLVGAINVAAIETVWSGLVTPPKGKSVSDFNYDHSEKDFAKGEEMGRFNMGSTVILLTTDKVEWSQLLTPGQTLKMGELIGQFKI